MRSGKGNSEEKESKNLVAMFPCNECDYYATEKSVLYEHRRSNHGIHCNECNQKFASQGVLNKHKEAKKLKKHLLNQALNNKKIKAQQNVLNCSYCHSTFLEESDLKAHIESEHETMKYPCGNCPYQVTSLKMYLRHVKTHHM